MWKYMEIKSRRQGLIDALARHTLRQAGFDKGGMNGIRSGTYRTKPKNFFYYDGNDHFFHGHHHPNDGPFCAVYDAFGNCNDGNGRACYGYNNSRIGVDL